jgi:hypothetical protein
MAKDKSDTKTRDMITSKNASNQRIFKERMRNKGYTQKTLWIHKESFEAGKNGIEFKQEMDYLSHVLGSVELNEKKK